MTGLIYTNARAGHGASELPVDSQAKPIETCSHQIVVPIISFFTPDNLSWWDAVPDLAVAFGDASIDAAQNTNASPIAVLDQDYLSILSVYSRYCQRMVPGVPKK